MPSSLPADRNFWGIVEGEVIIVGLKVVQKGVSACSEAFGAGQLIFEERKDLYAYKTRKNKREGTDD